MILKNKKLKKDLKLIDVFALSTGATLSAGFFLLPGIAAQQAGAAIVLAYMVAVVPLIPAMFSKIELATAMPRSGGVYFFLDRTLGPMFGTIGGIGIWLTLVLKVAFALIGLGAYLRIFFPSANIIPIALAIALFLGIVNYLGGKKMSGLQIVMVFTLLLILSLFIGFGIPQIDFTAFKGMFNVKARSIFSTAGLVYISYIGVTKVASISEEIDNPERNIPLGVFLSLGTAFLIYLFGSAVMVGVIPMNELAGSLIPVAIAGKNIFGKTGEILISLAALLAFLSVSNVGIMSASRYPLAMSRDNVLPAYFKKLNKFRMPGVAVMFTTIVIILIIIFFDPLKIAKLASAFQLLVFAFLSLAVIIMRESKIESYDPGFKSPFYPWMQIIGIIFSFFLIYEMGILPVVFSIGLIVVSAAWYWFYAKNKVVRAGAIYHIFERLGRQRYDELEIELREILKEKGLRKDDPFGNIVMRAKFFELNEECNFEELLDKVSEYLSSLIAVKPKDIKQHFINGTRIGATPVIGGIALPHFRLEEVRQTEMVLVRAKKGVRIKLVNPITHKEEDEKLVKALFFLVSPEDNPTQHLRILAQIATRVEDKNFIREWEGALNEQSIKETLLHDDMFVSIVVKRNMLSGDLINKKVKDLNLPEGSLITLISRAHRTVLPNGRTKILSGDRLTIIGSEEALKLIKEKFKDSIQ